MSLDILRQKISNDIEVIQPLKYDEYTFRTLKLSSTLYDDCINETTHANISKVNIIYSSVVICLLYSCYL